MWGRTETPGCTSEIGSDVAQDAQLVDVRVVLGVEPFQFRMQRLAAGARQAGIAVVDPDVRITDLEVGHVIVAGQPRWHGVGDLVGLGLEAGALDEAAQRFGIAEVFLERRRRTETCTEFPFVITMGDVRSVLELWIWTSLSTYSSWNQIYVVVVLIT